ncbi:hypothetical protein [uncultured Chryseobacterium sp.]|uniref:hypothetical protein n=1 Tax=uncultured Chryseobacterium sp. TaxID=259322 RepID=UPI0025E8CFF8|nr:hypothetical protein [uncultured Chryseobacterium sp.]
MKPQDYSRGRNNANAQQAFSIIAGSVDSMRQKVLDQIDGLKSTQEIAEVIGVPLHKVSGRFSELKAKNKIIQITSKKIGNSHFAVFSKNNI